MNKSKSENQKRHRLYVIDFASLVLEKKRPAAGVFFPACLLFQFALAVVVRVPFSSHSAHASHLVAAFWSLFSPLPQDGLVLLRSHPFALFVCSRPSVFRDSSPPLLNPFSSPLVFCSCAHVAFQSHLLRVKNVCCCALARPSILLLVSLLLLRLIDLLVVALKPLCCCVCTCARRQVALSMLYVLGHFLQDTKGRVRFSRLLSPSCLIRQGEERDIHLRQQGSPGGRETRRDAQ